MCTYSEYPKKSISGEPLILGHTHVVKTKKWKKWE